MHKRTVIVGASFVLSALASLPAIAQPKPLPDPSFAAPPVPPSPDPKNLDGTWIRPAAPYSAEAMKKVGVGQPMPPTPDMTAAGHAIFDKEEEARKAGRPVFSPAVKCGPTGSTRLKGLLYPFQIITTPGQVTIVHEHNRSIQIVYMDQDHPSPLPPPTWMGHSVGHWDGDTLVIDTIDARADQRLFPALPMTEKTRVIERLKKLNGGKMLEDVITVEDPELYTKPWTMRMEFDWTPGYYDRVGEYSCEENDTVESDNANAYHSLP